jgi:thiol-disulfide isomerase/thioredoxin
MMVAGRRHQTVLRWIAFGIALGMSLGVVAPAARGAGGEPAAVETVWPESVGIASLATILAAVRAKGARAVLVNVWATFCEPCREEMPDLMRFYRDNRARGLRLIMISVDDEEILAEVRNILRATAHAAAVDGTPEALAFIKREDDTKFVNGLDRRWSGALPATFLYDGQGVRRRSWLRPVTYAELDRRVDGLLKRMPTQTKTRTNSSTATTRR